MNTNFQKYLQRKKIFSFEHNGYLVHNIMSLDLILHTYNKKQFSIKESLMFFFRKNISLKSDNEILFTVGEYNRKDLMSILNFIKNGIDSSFIDLSVFNLYFSFSILNILKSFKHIVNNTQGFNFSQKISLFANMTYTLNTIDYLEKNSKNNIEQLKKCITFCSAMNEEAIITYFCKKRGITTYTLQHGLWFMPTNPTVDSISIENMISDYFLSWSQYTIDEFIKYGYDKSQFLLAGYPKESKVLIPKSKSYKPKLLVLFSRIHNHEGNLQLINLLVELKKTFKFKADFRLHPTLNISFYKKIAIDNGFHLEDSNLSFHKLMDSEYYDLSIVYNSSVYYESYANNCVCLRFIDKNIEDSIAVCDDSFKNINELREKLYYFFNIQENEAFWKNINKQLNYILGVHIDTYKKLLGNKNAK